MSRQFPGQVASRLRVVRKIGEKFDRLVPPLVLWLVGLSHDRAASRLVPLFLEPHAIFGALDMLSMRWNAGVELPAGKRQRSLNHILLRIAAGRAHRVKFEDLAGEVLIQIAVVPLAGKRIGSGRKMVVEVDQHSRIEDGVLQQVGELSGHPVPDVPGMRSVEQLDFGFCRRHGEMVAPEPPEALKDRTWTVYRRECLDEAVAPAGHVHIGAPDGFFPQGIERVA